MVSVAQSILKTYPDERIFVLNGDLGSGKTTFVKGFAKALNISENVSSPTFSIVHEYGSGGNKIFHFDLYRLENEQDLFQIGFEEYVDSGAYVLIEWPEMAGNLLPSKRVSITFEASNENVREIICSIENT
jgi:tRNA threonylcarbamoyladenosine biosynthesis protein TsaE